MKTQFLHYCINAVSRKDEIQGSVGRPVSPEEGAVEAVAFVVRFKESHNLRDAALAQLVGVNQSSVHRALNRRPPRLTPTLTELCNYAKRQLAVDSIQQAASGREQLAKAVAGVWDGSPEGLNKLLTFLRDLGHLVARR